MSNNHHTSEISETPKPAWPGWSFVILVLLLAFPSFGFIQKYTGLIGVAGYVAFVAIVFFLIWKFGVRFAPLLRRHFRLACVLIFAGFAVCFAIVYPIENSRGLGKSSDRDDGLNLAVTRMADGQSPYYQHDKFAGPLSVLPGGILLAAPFVALGNSAYQNLFWLAVFLVCANWWFKDRALALVLLTVPLALSPAAMYEYISGGDMLTNGIYVAVVFLLVMKLCSNPNAAGWLRWICCVLLGVCLASRSNFPLLLPLFGAALWQTVGWRQAVIAVVVVGLVEVVITVPFYLHDPAGFTPLLSRYKLAIVDHAMPWASKAMIGMTALLGILGAWVLLRSSTVDLTRSFFRWCTLVTLCPMVCAVALSSWISGRLDFAFMNERCGLMYMCFALFGWGGCLLDESVSPGVSGKESTIS
ncbi:MAG: hypothetical protein WCO57_14325 [Verrucomicrobiota bacterium]